MIPVQRISRVSVLARSLWLVTLLIWHCSFVYNTYLYIPWESEDYFKNGLTVLHVKPISTNFPTVLAITPNHAELPFRLSKQNDIPSTEIEHYKSSTCLPANINIMHAGGHSTLWTFHLVMSNLIPQQIQTMALDIGSFVSSQWGLFFLRTVVLHPAVTWETQCLNMS